MTNRNKRSGFTLAEVLITVAIIGILMGFGFVEVIRHQRRLQLKEMDEAAQEIFVASQNHLSAAYADGRWINYVSNGGYLGEKDETLTWDDNGKNHDIYYLTVNETTFPELINNYFLPFGAIDETIRSGGSYVIEYDPETASIYDVFFINDRSYNGLVSDRDNVRTMATNSESDRRINYPANNADRKIIGYYGQGKIGIIEVEDDSGVMIQIHNEDILWAEIIVTNPYEGSQQDNMTALFKVEGETSHKSKTFYLKRDWNSAITSDNTNSGTVGTISYDAQLQQGFYRTYQAEQADGKKNDVYIVILDAINYWANDKNNTAHFGKQYSDLIPGENIIVTAYAVDANDSSHAKTNSAMTNSLYGSYSLNEASANIYYTRHLQNLSSAISNVSYSDVGDLLKLNTVTIQENIDFAEFPKTELSKYPIDASDWINQAKIWHFIWNVPQDHLNNGEFHCITIEKLNSPFTVEGNEHVLKNFDFGYCDHDRAGLFSHTIAGKVLNVNKLFFEDPKINVQGKKVFVGVIAGCVDDGELNINNCGVYASSEAIYRSGAYDFTKPKTGLFDSVGIHINGGGVGGFVGKMSNGRLSINSSYATIPMYNGGSLSNDSILGGMLGYSYGNSATTISNSYVGGYTEPAGDGHYDYMPTSANLVMLSPGSNTGSLFAGGLVARPDSKTTITDSYCSASVFGVGNLGGITGKTGSTTISNSYYNSRVVGVKEKTNSIGLFTAGTNVSGTGNCVYDYTGAKYSTSLNGTNDYFIVPSTATNTLDLNKTGEDKIEKKELPEAVMSGPYTVAFSRRGEVYPYPTVNNTHSNKTVVADQSHYGDWASPEPLPEPAPAMEDGNKLAIHFTVAEEESYVTIKVTGKISGQSRYMNIYRDANGVLYGLNTPMSKDNITTQSDYRWGALNSTVFKHAYAVKNSDGDYDYTVWLDDPTIDGGSFAYLFCNGNDGKLFAGEDITITVTNGLKEPTEEDTILQVKANSMFAYKEDKPSDSDVYIESARHLLNLDTHYSGVNSTDYTDLSKMVVLNAHQTADIKWMSNDYSGDLPYQKYQAYLDEVKEKAALVGVTGEIRRTYPWAGLDNDPSKVNRFQPIGNDHLQSYDGGGFTLDSFVLYNGVNGGHSGFFSNSSNDVLKNISNLTINNVTVLSDQSTAALLAGVTDNSGITVSNVHITGDHTIIGGGTNYSGAIFAYADNSTITLKDVSVEGNALNIYADTDAGALIGHMDNVTLNVDGARISGGNLTVGNKANYSGVLFGSASLKESSSIRNVVIRGDHLSLKSASNGGGIIGMVSGAALELENISVLGEELSITSDKAEAGGLIGNSSCPLVISNAAVGGDNLKIYGVGSAGGLVGNASGKVTIQNSAASAYVKGNASWGGSGGLIGCYSGNDELHIIHSYAGGHTSNGTYADTLDETVSGHYNIVASAAGDGSIAGGLIGRISGGTTWIDDSYSTASVFSNSKSGGLVGMSDATLSIKDTYSTGMVKGGQYFTGILIGNSNNKPSCENVFYFDKYNSEVGLIGNKNSEQTNGLAVGANTTSAIENNPFKTTESYSANPYDKTLKQRYPFRSVNKVSLDGVSFDHIGDWPEPESLSVTFNPNGEGAVISEGKEQKDIYSGDVIGALPDESTVHWKNYVLLGWYTEPIGGEKIEVNTTVTESATFYAHWAEKMDVSSAASFTPQVNGAYLIEAWGAGSPGNTSVSHTSGTLYLTTSDTIYANVGKNGTSTDIRINQVDASFTSLASRIMVASGSNVEDGYFSNETGIERNSFVSGNASGNAIAGNSAEKDILFSGQGIHSSGWAFADPTIESEVNGETTGKVLVYRLVIGPTDSGDSQDYANGRFGGQCFIVESDEPIVTKEQDASVEISDELRKEEIADLAEITAYVSTKVTLGDGKEVPSGVEAKSVTEYSTRLSSSAYDTITIHDSENYELNGDLYVFKKTGLIEDNTVIYRGNTILFDVLVNKASIEINFGSYYGGKVIDNSSGTVEVNETISAKDLSVPAYNIVSKNGKPQDASDWSRVRLDSAQISVNGENYVNLSSISARSYTDNNGIEHGFDKGDEINVKFYFTGMSNPVYSAEPEVLKGNVGETGTFTIYAEDNGIKYNVTSAAKPLSVADNKIAEIDADGTVHYLERGITYITAGANGSTFKCALFVKNPEDEAYPDAEIINIAFKDLAVQKYIGDPNFSLQVDAVLATGDKVEISDPTTLTWSSSNTGVINVDESGIMTVKSAGTATITAISVEGYKAEIKVSVANNPLQIVLSKNSQNYEGDLFVGEGVSLGLVYNGANVDRYKLSGNITYDNDYFDLNYLTLTPKKEGDTVITITYQPQSGVDIDRTLVARKTVHISAGAVKSISFKEPSIFRSTDADPFVLSLNASYEYGPDHELSDYSDVSWIVEDGSGVIEFDSESRVVTLTGKSGNAIVTAKYGTLEASTTINVGGGLELSLVSGNKDALSDPSEIKVHYARGNKDLLNWEITSIETSDSEILSVGRYGLPVQPNNFVWVQPVGSGTATVTVTYSVNGETVVGTITITTLLKEAEPVPFPLVNIKELSRPDGTDDGAKVPSGIYKSGETLYYVMPDNVDWSALENPNIGQLINEKKIIKIDIDHLYTTDIVRSSFIAGDLYYVNSKVFMYKNYYYNSPNNPVQDTSGNWEDVSKYFEVTGGLSSTTSSPSKSRANLSLKAPVLNAESFIPDTATMRIDISEHEVLEVNAVSYTSGSDTYPSGVYSYEGECYLVTSLPPYDQLSTQSPDVLNRMNGRGVVKIDTSNVTREAELNGQTLERGAVILSESGEVYVNIGSNALILSGEVQNQTNANLVSLNAFGTVITEEVAEPEAEVEEEYVVIEESASEETEELPAVIEPLEDEGEEPVEEVESVVEEEAEEAVVEEDETEVVFDTYDLSYFVGQKDLVLPYAWKKTRDVKERISPYEADWDTTDADVVAVEDGQVTVNGEGEAILSTVIEGTEIRIHVSVTEDPKLDGFNTDGADYEVLTANEDVLRIPTNKWPTIVPEDEDDTVTVTRNRIVEESGAFYLITEDFETDWDELVGNIGSYLGETDEEDNHYVVLLPLHEMLVNEDFEEDGTAKVELLPGDVYQASDTVYVLISERDSVVQPEVDSEGWYDLKDLNDYDPGADTGPESDAPFYYESKYNPYPGTISSNCTFAVWAIANQTLGVRLPNWGDAGNWYRRAGISGYVTGETPAANSIIVWDHHVGYVTAVSEDGTMLYIREGNFGKKYHEGWWPVSNSRNGMKLYGYVYLTDDIGAATEVPSVVVEEGFHGSEEEFLRILGELGLEAGERTEAYDEDVPAGDILSYTPTGEVMKGSVVNYTVSLGQETHEETIEVTNSLLGMSRHEVLVWFDKYGLTGHPITEEGTEDSEDGTVNWVRTGSYRKGDLVDFRLKHEEKPVESDQEEVPSEPEEPQPVPTEAPEFIEEPVIPQEEPVYEVIEEEPESPIEEEIVTEEIPEQPQEEAPVMEEEPMNEEYPAE